MGRLIENEREQIAGTMTRKRRVYYVASIPVEFLNTRLGQRHHVGAASNKVLGVCSALRTAGVFPVVLSGIYTRREPWATSPHYFRARPSVYVGLYTFGAAALRRVLFSLSLCAFFARRFSNDHIVIFYNYYPDYVLPSIMLRALGRPAVLDIEDGPRADEPGLRALSNRISLRLLRKFCADKYLTVSHDLGRQMKLGDYLPVHGVVAVRSTRAPSPRRFKGEEIRVIFGGSIEHATGLSLFSDALRELARRTLPTRLHCVVTGLFPRTELEQLLQDIEGSSSIRLTLCHGLSAAEYASLLEGMDVGLSLRLVESSLGLTTFPSKAIEYTSLGLLLITTPSPGISEVFDDDQAVILDDDSPETLVDALVEIASNPEAASERATAGRRRCHDVFSSEEVGRRLIDFLGE